MTSSTPSRVFAAILAAGTVGLAACSDSPVAPRQSAESAAPSALLSGLLAGSGVTVTATTTLNGVTTETLVVDPRSNVKFGGDDYMINIPAFAICDPLTSGYGPALWDAPCLSAVLPITFQVKSWVDAAGNSRTEIKPDIRFSPSKSVSLHLKSRLGSQSAGTRINWCPTGSALCVDESRNDASLATQRDVASGKVYRRVKHFSGYMVSVGLTGEGSDSTDSNIEIQ